MNTQNSLDAYDRELDIPEYHDPVLQAQADATPRLTTSPAQNLESLARQRELSTEAVKGFRFANQQEVTSDRIGRLMHQNEFLRLLRKITPCQYNDWSKLGMTGLNLIKNTGFEKRLVYVCGVQNGWMPEFSTIRVDAHGLPTKEKYRGWRTVLLNLISGGHITQAQALKVFGNPTPGLSDRYERQLQQERNLA